MINKVKCKHYDEENGWCKKLSDWSDPMPTIVYCPESPCEHAEPIEQPMTDNDIIKALEEEKKYVMGLQHRLECHGEETPGLIKNCVLLSNTLNLINRQKAQIEKLYIALEENQKATKLWKDIAHRETGYVKIARAEAIKEFAERLRNKFFNYYDGLTEHTSKSNHNGDSLMFYEVADMITDCIESTEEEMTEEQE